MRINIKPNSIVLFQGDSITDGGRSRFHPESYGSGYVQKVVSEDGFHPNGADHALIAHHWLKTVGMTFPV